MSSGALPPPSHGGAGAAVAAGAEGARGSQRRLYIYTDSPLTPLPLGPPHMHGLFCCPEFRVSRPLSRRLSCSPIVGYFLFGVVGTCGEGASSPASGPSCLHVVTLTPPIKQASQAWLYQALSECLLPTSGCLPATRAALCWGPRDEAVALVPQLHWVVARWCCRPGSGHRPRAAPDGVQMEMGWRGLMLLSGEVQIQVQIRAGLAASCLPTLTSQASPRGCSQASPRGGVTDAPRAASGWGREVAEAKPLATLCLGLCEKWLLPPPATCPQATS